jgi:NAD(P) transhydrogenase subunit beta
MVVAIITTLCLVEASSLWLIALAIALGGGIGAVVARKIKMTALPQLVVLLVCLLKNIF